MRSGWPLVVGVTVTWNGLEVPTPASWQYPRPPFYSPPVLRSVTGGELFHNGISLFDFLAVRFAVVAAHEAVAQVYDSRGSAALPFAQYLLVAFHM